MKEKGKLFSSKRLKNLSALVAARGCKIATELVFFEFLFPIFAFPAVLSNTRYLCIVLTLFFFFFHYLFCGFYNSYYCALVLVFT